MDITNATIKRAHTVDDEAKNYLISQPEALQTTQVEQNSLFGIGQTPPIVNHSVVNRHYANQRASHFY